MPDNKAEIEYLSIYKLIPYARNTRTHNKEQVLKIASSIKEFGFTNPILIDKDNGIIAGHGRVLAAEKLNIKELPCIRLGYLTDAQKKAYIIADNRLALDAGWDEELLKIELEELKELDFDIELTGFSDKEFNEIFKEEIKEDEFDTEKALNEIVEPITKRGDIWQLGKHRLMCGDSVSRIDINALIENNPIYLIFTDPPYGMSAVSKSGVLKEKYKTDILNDNNNLVAIECFNLCQDMFKQSNQVWWGANYYAECLPSSECWIVWDKNNGGSDQTDCELAWANFRSVVRQFTLASEKRNRVHPTQKPVKLIADIFDKFDKQNTFKNVLDLFGGSGSTLMAAEETNRVCYMMELDPKFCDVIIKRYEEYTGDKAILL